MTERSTQAEKSARSRRLRFPGTAPPVPKSRRLGLYVHIPFCLHKCPYCDFVSGPVDPAIRGSHLKALHLEIEGNPWAGSVVDSLYIGGGTPSELSHEEFASLKRALDRWFDLSAVREFTIECNPNSLTPCKLEHFKDLKCDRISIGVQSFRDDHLKMLGRTHDSEESHQAVLGARQSGMTNISVDLMCSIPGQSLADWKMDLEEALSLQVEHLSLYNLTFERGTEFSDRRARGELRETPEDLAAEMFGLAMDLTSARGYQQYELSNFALPGRECLHNLRYWDGGDYLGLGLGAASFVSGRRWRNAPKYSDYAAGLQRGNLPVSETEKLVPEEALREAVMLGLRTSRGVDFEELSRSFQIDVPTLFREQTDFLTGEGLIQPCGRRLTLTRRGKLLADRVVVEFL